MRCPARGAELHAQYAARGEAEPAVGGFAVHQKLATVRPCIRDARPVASSLLPDHEEQPDARLTLRPERLDGRDLRGQNSFRVARAAAVEPIALEAAREKWRHTVEMGREHDRWWANGRENVEPLVVHRLFGDRECVVPQKGGKPAAHLRLPSRRRVDVDEGPRQLY